MTEIGWSCIWQTHHIIYCHSFCGITITSKIQNLEHDLDLWPWPQFPSNGPRTSYQKTVGLYDSKRMTLSNKSSILNFQREITPIRCLPITQVKINQIILKSRRTIWWKQFAKIFYGFRDIAITRKKGRGEITPIRISVRSHRVSFEPRITVQHHWQKKLFEML